MVLASRVLFVISEKGVSAFGGGLRIRVNHSSSVLVKIEHTE